MPRSWQRCRRNFNSRSWESSAVCPHEIINSDLSRFGKLERKGKTLHRFRLGDYRLYFERHELGVVVHRILNRNTIKDFLFRSRLPLGEDEVLQDNPKFWELIEAAKRNPS